MVKKLTRAGNSLALVLDKPLLEAANVDADTPLEVSTDGNVIINVFGNPATKSRPFTSTLVSFSLG